MIDEPRFDDTSARRHCQAGPSSQEVGRGPWGNGNVGADGIQSSERREARRQRKRRWTVLVDACDQAAVHGGLDCICRPDKKVGLDWPAANRVPRSIMLGGRCLAWRPSHVPCSLKRPGWLRRDGEVLPWCQTSIHDCVRCQSHDLTPGPGCGPPGHLHPRPAERLLPRRVAVAG